MDTVKLRQVAVLLANGKGGEPHRQIHFSKCHMTVHRWNNVKGARTPNCRNLTAMGGPSSPSSSRVVADMANQILKRTGVMHLLPLQHIGCSSKTLIRNEGVRRVRGTSPFNSPCFKEMKAILLNIQLICDQHIRWPRRQTDLLHTA